MHKVKYAGFNSTVTEPTDGTSSNRGGEIHAYGFNTQEACDLYEDGDCILVVSKKGIAHRVPMHNVRWYRRAEPPTAAVAVKKPAA